MVNQVLQVNLGPLVKMAQRVKVVILASLVSLVCAIHPCAMEAWWGGILTAKAQTIDIRQHHCRHQYKADAEQIFSGRSHHYSSSLTWKQNVPLLTPFMWHLLCIPVSLMVFCIISHMALNILWKFNGVKRINDWLQWIPLITLAPYMRYQMCQPCNARYSLHLRLLRIDSCTPSMNTLQLTVWWISGFVYR